jgi:N-ethylmaleimide reductase
VLPPGLQPCAPSAIAAAGSVWSQDGDQPLEVPRALSRSEIAGVIDDHVRVARRAMAAGFSGVQLHAGSGYLGMQFLAFNTNFRDDAYGGTPARRARFVIELVEALAGAVGAHHTSLKLTPGKRFNDIDDREWHPTCSALLAALKPLPLAFVECAPDTGTADDDAAVHTALRALVPGPYAVGGGSAAAKPQALPAAHGADAVMFGRAFIANPDLPARLGLQLPLNAVDDDTVYGGDHRGYTDYAFSSDEADPANFPNSQSLEP